MARILIVDDTQSHLDLMRDILLKYAEKEYRSQWDLIINTAENANIALELVQQFNYEMLIVDIAMARMNGFEFIKEVRKKFPQLEVPVVIVSAVDGIDLEYQSIRHGASAWFRKPLSPKKFARDVFRLLEGS
jgi:CheY-like chemotaxis protein